MAVKEKKSTKPDAPVKMREGWRMVKFGDVVREVKVTVDPETSGLERYVAGEHMNTDDLRIRRWGTIGDGYLGPAFHRKFIRGQILYGSRRTYLRKVAVADFDGICANTTFILEPKGEDLLSELLPFIMQTESFSAHAVKQSRGSVNPYVNFRDIAWYEFPLPPKNEQRRIAEMLSIANKNFHAREKVLDEIIHLRQLVIDDLLSDVSSGNAVALRDICEMQNGRPFPSDDYQSSGVKLLRPGNLGSNGYFYWGDDVTKFLPDDYLQTAADFLVEENDVVINLTAQSLEDGFMGRVCFAKRGDSSLLNQRIGRFRCAESIYSEYLFRCLQTSRFRKLVETSCEGSKIRHLYWRHIEGFMIPLPSKEEQKSAIAAVASVDSAIRTARASVLDARRLSSQLRETLLSSD